MTQQSDQINELATALSKAQGKITGALKDSSNPFFKTKYADLASVWDACREQLSANGLAVVQTLSNDAENIVVITTLTHSSGQWMRGSLAVKPVKSDPQGIGSAITYARRYALAAIVGVAQIDDDAEAAMGRKQAEVAKITPEQVDNTKVTNTVEWIKKKIDLDTIEETHTKVKEVWSLLSNNERMEVDAQLKDKAPNSNKSYKNLLKEYLAYIPSSGDLKDRGGA